MAVINTNVQSLIADASMRASNNALLQAWEPLFTGKKINSAKDDAAGLAISSRMTSQVRGLNMAIKNANDGINLAQTAEGAMNEITDMLQRMRELAIQSGNTTNSGLDRSAMNDEIKQLQSEINRVAQTTQFNGMNILDGSFNGKLQIGNNSGQTMDLAVSSMSAASMGETVNGLSKSATKANLVVSGASRNVADYQGASFNVSVNGVNATVTMPVSTPTSVQASGATAALAPINTDVVGDVSSNGILGAYQEKTISLATAPKQKLELSVNGSAVQVIDVGSATAGYFADNTKVTGAELVNALQTEINKNSFFKGANAVKASLTSDGFVSLTLASGNVGTIKITDDTAAIIVGSTMASVVFGATANASVTSTTGFTPSITGGTASKTFAANTSFSIGANNLDIRASVLANNFDIANLTTDQFITAYNQTAKVNGQQLSSVSTDTQGNLYFTVKPSSSNALPADKNGDLAGTGLTITAAGVDITSFAKTTGTFGQKPTTVTGATDGTVSVKVGDNNSYTFTLAAKKYYTMSDLASEMQKNLNTAFKGSDAVTVLAVKDKDNNWGLKFANDNGKAIDIQGNFITTAAAAPDVTTTFFAASPYASNSVVGTNELTFRGLDTPASIGTDAFIQRTVDLTTAGTNTAFSIAVNGGATTALDIAASITKLGYTSSKLTGEQVVNALNDTFKTAGFAGNNAVTASIDSGGHLNLTVAGASSPSATPTLTYTVVAADFFTKMGAATGAITANASGKMLVAASNGAAETFGIQNLTLASPATTTLGVTVGSNQLVNLSLTAQSYTDAYALATEINTKIASSGAFTGANGLQALVVVDDKGNQGLKFTSSSGQSIKVSGTLLTAVVAGGAAGGIAKVDLSVKGITFPATPALNSGIDMSKGSTMTLSVTSSTGQVTTKAFDLGLTSSHTSYADYASALQNAANTAFASDGISFNAGVSAGKLQLTSTNPSVKTFSATGQAVNNAFGGAVSGTAPVTQLEVNKFVTMNDVAKEITKDLNGAAVATFDDTAKTWSFNVLTGDNGAASSISLSGAGLAAVQMSGTLAATGQVGDATAAKLSNIDVLTTGSATAALGSIDNSIEYVSKQRALLGAIENRLEHTVNNLTNIVTNTQASRSAIEDTDYSKETSALAKSQIITQAATAMLAQANQSAQSVLSLLK